MATLLLPKLKDRDVSLQAGEPGKWQRQTNPSFKDVAASLDLAQFRDEIPDVNSIPTMWAHPLLVEMALQSESHILRNEKIEHWRGMLAAIALAEYLSRSNYHLQAHLLELDKESDRFAQALNALAPSLGSHLYRLDGDGKDITWTSLYLFTWNGQPVGTTSPSTLVFPSVALETNWQGLPWFVNGKLRSPRSSDLDAEQTDLLCKWLGRLNSEINQDRYQGNHDAIAKISKLIKDFCRDLGGNPEATVQITDTELSSPEFLGTALNLGVLSALARPIKVRTVGLSVVLVPSEDKQDAPSTLLIDPRIPEVLDRPKSDIILHESITLANYDEPRDLPRLQEKFRCIKPEDIFLEEIYFIERKNALNFVDDPRNPQQVKSSLMPTGSDRLTFAGNPITILLPLKSSGSVPLLLEYFTATELISKMEVGLHNNGAGVRISIQLPLNAGTYPLEKVYDLKEKNRIEETPILELYPSFRIEGWKRYYALYYDLADPEKTFQVEIPGLQEKYNFEAEDGGNYLIARLEEFPHHIFCRKEREEIGTILLNVPKLLTSEKQGTLSISVDFGTSSTNVFTRLNDRDKPVQCTLASLHYPITNVEPVARGNTLLQYFIPSKMDFPLPTLLTTKNGERQDNRRIIFDTRIFVPTDPETIQDVAWLEANLKWRDTYKQRELIELFLEQLAFQIAAQAVVKHKISQIQWSLSYPSAFSKRDKESYIDSWRRASSNLKESTGIDFLCPSLEQENRNYWRSESLASGRYFMDRGESLLNTTCIDIGGGTSDISIWRIKDGRRSVIYQCSVQLAGRDLFANIIAKKPELMKTIEFPQAERLTESHTDLFIAKLDLMMRDFSESWLSNKWRRIREKGDFQGFQQIMAIGIAGLYYYVGMILHVLYEEEKLNEQQVTAVILGGNGSRLLNWLTREGKYERRREPNRLEIDRLLNAMLIWGSGFPLNQQERQEASSQSVSPKNEVASGLLIDRGKKLEGRNSGENTAFTDLMMGVEGEDENDLISGEWCKISDREFEWNQRLDIDPEESIKSYKIFEGAEHRNLVQLPRFLWYFHQGLLTQKVKDIIPLPKDIYKKHREIPIKGDISLDFWKNHSDLHNDNKSLWQDVNDEIINYLSENDSGSEENRRMEPAFIISLKALLMVLSKRWGEGG